MEKQDLTKFIDRISPAGPGGREKLKKALKDIIENGHGELTIEDIMSLIEEATSTKQDTLLSGRNIKTVNGLSILGSGNLEIPKGDDGKGIITVNAVARQSALKDPMTVECSTRDDVGGVILDMIFYNFKGAVGDRGPAGIENVEVSVDSLPGTPRVAATIANSILSLAFYGLKGMKGDPGTSHSRQMVVTERPSADSADADTVYLVQIGDTDEYERWIIQNDGTNIAWLQIGTTEMILDDYIKKSDIVHLTEDQIEEMDNEDFDSTKYYVTYEDEEA